MDYNQLLEETVDSDPILVHGDQRPRTRSFRAPHRLNAGRLPGSITTPFVSVFAQNKSQFEDQTFTSTPPKRPLSNIAPKKTRSRKRMRVARQSAEDVEDHRSTRSPSPSLISDEEEDELGAVSSAEQHTASPTESLKKKRTRTLTTPHQSAVLHALLAQSRFPTTAMREEVGRQIGLSPRKVQVWFQNQRQKAKKSKGDGETPLTRVPQFGPFPGTAGQAPVRYEDVGRHSSASRPEFIEGSSRFPSLSRSTGLPASYMQLVGDNPPGTILFETLQASPAGQVSEQYQASGLPSAPTHTDYAHAPGMHRRMSSSMTVSPLSRSSHPLSTGPSIVLPPLPSSRRNIGSSLPGVNIPFTDPGSTLSRMSSSTSPRAVAGQGQTLQHTSQRQSTPFTSRNTISSRTLPPPFALQPAPQWTDDLSPLQLTSGSRRGSDTISSATGPPQLSQSAITDNESLMPATQRHRRFDPIRASASDVGERNVSPQVSQRGTGKSSPS